MTTEKKREWIAGACAVLIVSAVVLGIMLWG